MPNKQPEKLYTPCSLLFIPMPLKQWGWVGVGLMVLANLFFMVTALLEKAS